MSVFSWTVCYIRVYNCWPQILCLSHQLECAPSVLAACSVLCTQFTQSITQMILSFVPTGPLPISRPFHLVVPSPWPYPAKIEQSQELLSRSLNTIVSQTEVLNCQPLYFWRPFSIENARFRLGNNLNNRLWNLKHKKEHAIGQEVPTLGPQPSAGASPWADECFGLDSAVCWS